MVLLLLYIAVQLNHTHLLLDGEFELVYKPVELDVLVFAHLMSFLERLLLYKGGRQLFPVQLGDKNGMIQKIL